MLPLSPTPHPITGWGGNVGLQAHFLRSFNGTLRRGGSRLHRAVELDGSGKPVRPRKDATPLRRPHISRAVLLGRRPTLVRVPYRGDRTGKIFRGEAGISEGRNQPLRGAERRGGAPHKPGSGLSVISLVPALRTGTSDRTRESAGRVILPYSILLRAGLAEPDDHSSAGGLLPHRFTLTDAGGPAPAVCSLLRFPWVRTRWDFPSALPCGARTFLRRTDPTATERDTPYCRIPHGSGFVESGKPGGSLLERGVSPKMKGTKTSRREGPT